MAVKRFLSYNYRADEAPARLETRTESPYNAVQSMNTEKIVTGVIVMLISFPLAIWSFRWRGSSWKEIIIILFGIILYWIFFI